MGTHLLIGAVFNRRMSAVYRPAWSNLPRLFQIDSGVTDFDAQNGRCYTRHSYRIALRATFFAASQGD